MAPYEIIGNFAVKFLDSEVLIVTLLSESTLFAIAEIAGRVGDLLRLSKIADVGFEETRRLGMFYHSKNISKEMIRELLAKHS